MHLSTGDHAGPYVISATLGAGGMGDVYRARDPEMSRDIALRILPGELARDPDRLREFEREARAAGALKHPNLAAVYDVGRAGPDWYVASELVEGKSLRQTLAHGPLPAPQVIEIGIQIAEGLAAAHAAGIVHGDLRPENVMLTHNGRVKILDFGLAAGQKATGSDIFSAGAILYEMLTGRRASEPPELDAGVPAGLAQVVERCLEKDPERRYATASDLSRALQAVEALRVKRGVIWPAWGVAAALVTAAALGGAASWLASRFIPTDPPRFSAVTTAEGSVAFASLYGESPVYSFTPEGGEQHTYLAGEPGGTRQLDLPNGSVVTSISKRGELAQLSSWSVFGSTLFRQPLSGGEPQRVLDGVCDAQWSPDGSELAVVRFVGGKYRLEYPIGKLLLETSGLPSPIGISPDGKQVAIIVREKDGRYLQVVNRGEGVVRLARVGDEPSRRPRPRWRADGREIWFSSPDAERAGTVSAVDLRGRERVVARFPGDVLLEDLSASGKVLLSRNQSYRRVLLERDGQPVRDLSWNNAFAVALSPDGRRVGLTDYSGNREYYVRSSDGGDPARFERGFISAFSPDGNWMAVIRAGREEQMGFVPVGASGAIPPEFPGLEKATFLGWMPDSRRFLFAAGQEGARSFYLASLDGGAPKPVAGARADEPLFDSAVAPDGRRMWLLGAGKHWIFDLASSKWSQVRGLSVDDIVLGWTEDSRSLFVAPEAPDGHLARIDRVDVESGARKPFKTLPSGILPGRGALITPDGKARVYTSVKSVSDLWLAEGLK